MASLSRLLDQTMKPLPSWLLHPNLHYAAIGSPHSIFNQQRILTGASTFTPSCVQKTISDCLGLGEAEIHELEKARYALVKDQIEYKVSLENAKYLLPKLILLLKVMTKAGIEQLQYLPTNGNCNALLISEKFWPSPAKTYAAVAAT